MYHQIGIIQKNKDCCHKYSHCYWDNFLDNVLYECSNWEDRYERI